VVSVRRSGLWGAAPVYGARVSGAPYSCRVPSSHDRSRLAFKLRYAARYPERIWPYTRRRARELRLRIRAKDHVSYYRAVMHANAAGGANAAVGSDTQASWLSVGELQFDYLREHGLEAGMRMLEIGCGNLRAGRLFIDYLDPGSYYGIDISPDILVAALDTITTYGLQDKLPRLALVEDLKLSFLPDQAFDVVHAHSVFSHSPIEVIDECLRHVGRIMAPAAFFDFTLHLTEGSEHQVLHEDFYYRAETLTQLATRYGLQTRLMDDWGAVHQQSKLRVTRLVPDPAPAHVKSG
jgi:ubiquinone/menaquinone biosynthesis C-methylase UbiE